MITLVTGGSSSGEPEYAEGPILDSSCPRRFYAVTTITYGKEGRDKVERHRMPRQGEGFITIEKPRDVERVTSEEHKADSGASSWADRVFLPERILNLAANEMPKEEETGEAKVGEQQGNPIQCLSHKTAEGITSLAGQIRDMVIVIDEVGRNGICYRLRTVEYIHLMGCPNQKLASATDWVMEMVYGIPVLWKPVSGQAAVGADLTKRGCQGE